MKRSLFYCCLIAIFATPELILAQSTMDVQLGWPDTIQLYTIVGKVASIYLLGKWLDAGERFSFDLLKTVSLAFLVTVLMTGLLLQDTALLTAYSGILAYPYLSQISQTVGILTLVDQWYFYTLLFLGTALIYQIIKYFLFPKSAVADDPEVPLDENSPLARTSSQQ